jgi:hypothetical protein
MIDNKAEISTYEFNLSPKQRGNIEFGCNGGGVGINSRLLNLCEPDFQSKSLSSCI